MPLLCPDPVTTRSGLEELHSLSDQYRYTQHQEGWKYHLVALPSQVRAKDPTWSLGPEGQSVSCQND